MRSSSDSASCSRRRGARGIRALLVLLSACAGPLPATATVFHSQQEGLAMAFPDADRIEEKTYILKAGQREAIEKRARAPLDSELVTLYTGWKGNELLGWAFIDIHTVRTLPEAFLVVLGPDGSVRSLRVLAFHEPLDYLPTDRWYRQFDGRSADEPLRLGGDIHGIVGATLSARAVTRSVRRVLAYHDVLIRGEPFRVSGPVTEPSD